MNIGDKSEIRDYCFIGANVYIGKNTRIYQHCNIVAWSIVKDDCFIGHQTSFCNDKDIMYPDPDGEFVPDPPIVDNNVRIGAGVVVLPGVRLAQGCKVGAGSVVTRSVPSGETWAGNPAKRTYG